jgi:hypothetical protein
MKYKATLLLHLVQIGSFISSFILGYLDWKLDNSVFVGEGNVELLIMNIYIHSHNKIASDPSSMEVKTINCTGTLFNSL